MGCFGSTGFISSLPIECGDDTVLIFMTKNKYVDGKNAGCVYSTDFFIPTFLPVIGKYDDYGKIDNIIESASTKYIEDFFGEDIDTIIEKVDDNCVGREDNLTVSKNNDIFQELSFGLELKSVYDKLSKEGVFSFSNSLKPYSLETYLSHSYNNDKFMISGQKFPDTTFDKIVSQAKGIKYENPIETFINNIGEGAILEFIYFNHGVSMVKSKYFPSNYGSQTPEHILHYKMLSLYRNIIVNKLSNYDNYDEIMNELKQEIRDEKLSDVLK